MPNRTGLRGGPLFIGGAVKVAYDLLSYRSFRHLRPPEEVRQAVVRRAPIE
jgi:hypothetical protein